MKMRARLIYNPTSGHETMLRSVGEILNVLEQAGYEASAFQTTPAAFSAEKEAERAARAGFDLILAAGGDGTINEVVNGIAPLKHRPKMAIIPAGTTNDYARALKIPREDPVEAAKVILKHQTVKMDIGQANEKYFMNIAGGGFMTELTYDVPSEFKSVLGYLAYVLKGAEMLPRIRPVDMKIQYDDGVYEGPASMFLLGLTNSVGGMEQIAPDASLDDGNFALIVVKTGNPAEILRLMTMVLNGGRHVNDPNIIYTKTRKVVARTVHGEEMKINLDGEFGGVAPMTFVNLRQHIEMFANVDEIPRQALSNDEQIDHTPEN
ncbi:diacylglycerol kinase [Lapidilactobacillus gannanensis]|jgi:diacylglycerol kinase (ATP)|uniref:Diacylglycerol kinase n=1 Tax=Lapidilactobacillus gannanensis TaxID=2486002 RepID=A0ABW4BM68_9LACO|nr:diacylglycerol kinase [Lapidilactobacillus gannanensis]MCH4056736.1 diacylglycerol kinase [Lactobacillaceae bacterium]